MFSFPSQNKKLQGYGCGSNFKIDVAVLFLRVKYFDGKYPGFDPLSGVFQIWMFLNSEVFELCTVFGISLGSWFHFVSWLCYHRSLMWVDFEMQSCCVTLLIKCSFFFSLVRVVFTISYSLRPSSSLSANIRHESVNVCKYFCLLSVCGAV